MLTNEQLRAFGDDGILVLRGVVGADELAALRAETLALVERAAAGVDDPDFKYRHHDVTGERVPYRIEYVVDKTASGRALLGNPFVLEAVEQLQGRRFVPTWDSMVFKQAGAGAAVDWHRDAGREHHLGDAPIFNVDFYLDPSDRTNCLWAIPGSHRWSEEKAAASVAALSEGGFRTEGALPLELDAGDVLLHDILVVHGSPAAQSGLRRVLYFEFRPSDVELAVGPHVPEYVPLKQQVLLAAIEARRHTTYAAGEESFAYGGGDVAPGAPTSWRFAHEDYWRSAA